MDRKIKFNHFGLTYPAVETAILTARTASDVAAQVFLQPDGVVKILANQKVSTASGVWEANAYNRIEAVLDSRGPVFISVRRWWPRIFRETPERSKMHAAYRRKTRRR